MAMAPTVKAILGTFDFAVFWVLVVFPSVPFMPIGRTAGSLLGAMLMVLFQVVTPDQAYEAIDLQILGLLFGTMVVSVYLEREDMFKYLEKFLSWKSKGSKDLLCRICFVSAIFSAFFTNDTSCVVFTEFVLKLARQQNLSPLPFLLALASSANIGSSATLIGNPQNLVIAVQSKIPFGEFLFGIAAAMVVGILVNALILLCMFRKELSVQKDDEKTHLTSQNSRELEATNLELMSVQSSTVVNGNMNITLKDTNVPKSVAENESLKEEEERVPLMPSSPNKSTNTSSDENMDQKSSKWNNNTLLLKKIGVYLITFGMLVSFLLGLNMSWTAIAAALALTVLDFKDAQPCLEKVSYTLLVLFCGMFVTVDGFNRTGIPSAFWEFMEPHAQIDHISGVAFFALVIVFLSNLASNVPTVLLLGARAAAAAAAISPEKEKKSWLILAWVSTVAGNLSLLGSAANLIVCERAQNFGYDLTFWAHLKFGVPSTFIVTAIGLTLIRV